MELERLEIEWYADGLEAVLALHMRFEGEPPPYLVEVVRPCCERFTHAPQWPDPERGLNCIVPRESFERRETIQIRIKGPAAPDQPALWEAEARADEIEGKPRLEILQRGRILQQRAA